MDDSNPLTSLTIPHSLLVDSAKERPRPPNDRKYSLITTKTHPFLPLSIHNYTNVSAFHRQSWDDLGLAARSLVTKTGTGKVISRSLPKFFNFHEKWAYKPSGDEYAWRIEEKVDGSLISLFWYGDVKEWMIVSRSAFESASMHATSARRILERKYPGVLKRLDKEMTYVFELVDPRLPIKVVYKEEDLFLLSIVSKDGKEPEYEFDWTTLPFPRPRTHGHDHNTASKKVLNLKELSKLNLDNEEGFVVLFWTTPEDRRPKRIKVKFESYLDSDKISTKELGKAMSKISLSSSSPSHPSSSVPIPPSNARILEIYTNHRLRIQHFKSVSVSSTMAQHKQRYLQSLEPIADDYGGPAWLEMVEKTWDRVDAIFSLQEGELREKMAALQKEGYRPDVVNAKEGAKEKFERRIKKKDVDPAFRDALMSRYLKEPVNQQVGLFVKGLEVPQDLRSVEVLKAL